MVPLLFWLGVLSSQLKCQEQSSSDAITFITSRSITDSRSAIRPSLPTAPQPSVSRSVMSWPSASAALFPRLCASTFSVKRSSASKVTSRRSSCFSEAFENLPWTSIVQHHALALGRSLTSSQGLTCGQKRTLERSKVCIPYSKTLFSISCWLIQHDGGCSTSSIESICPKLSLKAICQQVD